jgi:hypothetical protein
MSDDERNGHDRPAGEEGSNAAPPGNDYARNASGNQTRGPERHNFKHGLYSQYLSKADRDMLDEIGGEDASDQLKMLIDLNIVRLLRAADAIDEPVDLEKIADGEVEMLDGPLADRAEALSKMIKRYKDITDGEQVNVSGQVEHTHETNLTDEEQQLFDELCE